MVHQPRQVDLFPLQASNIHDDLEGDNHILLQYETKHPESAVAAAAFVNSLRASRPKIVVFDKDGTLGDCTASLRRWTNHMTNKVRDILVVDGPEAEDVVRKFHNRIGWDAARNDVIPSASVAAGTWDEIVTLVYQFLRPYAPVCQEPVTLALAQNWHLELGNLHGQDTPLLDDLKGMMETCQRLGYLVGVCTSDDRAATDVALKSWGIEMVVDVSICGNEVSNGKPSAVPLQQLCQKASTLLQQRKGSSVPPILPQDCIVVGDTSADTGMARAAKAGFCVGVLTGSGTTEQLLETGAHLILPHVGHIPALLETLEGLTSEQQEAQ